ncbi:YqcC family protein [Tatumella citrea]|uniref:YqcC-like domain-containing protein n=1 Tax=Tatumella citrea TaxID=53336 RepID=A0A1Y0L553_TATCI|nr:YqcC family protein [Tatumella citrea]ARU93141.1 hypothetical protein A7K98_04635 [Tatumella citrea]ARU97180.1 hypothetical protein A7K99_04635 [Tatumella citrea]
MTSHPIIQQRLTQLEQILRDHQLWQQEAPEPQALNSDQPFCLDKLHPLEWLQWVLIPRLTAMVDAGEDLPVNMVVTPYFEMALEPHLSVRPVLLVTLSQLDGLFAQESV